jgi:hypothetical protein
VVVDGGVVVKGGWGGGDRHADVTARPRLSPLCLQVSSVDRLHQLPPPPTYSLRQHPRSPTSTSCREQPPPLLSESHNHPNLQIMSMAHDLQMIPKVGMLLDAWFFST